MMTKKKADLALETMERRNEYMNITFIILRGEEENYLRSEVPIR